MKEGIFFTGGSSRPELPSENFNASWPLCKSSFACVNELARDSYCFVLSEGMRNNWGAMENLFSLIAAPRSSNGRIVGAMIGDVESPKALIVR